MKRLLIMGGIFLLLSFFNFSATTNLVSISKASQFPLSKTSSLAEMKVDWGRMPLYFIENRG